MGYTYEDAKGQTHTLTITEKDGKITKDPTHASQAISLPLSLTTSDADAKDGILAKFATPGLGTAVPEKVFVELRLVKPTPAEAPKGHFAKHMWKYIIGGIVGSLLLVVIVVIMCMGGDKEATEGDEEDQKKNKKGDDKQKGDDKE